MCPDWESNPQPFHLQADAQPTEPHQPGPHPLSVIALLVIFCVGRWYSTVLCICTCPSPCCPQPRSHPVGTHHTVSQSHAVTLDGLSLGSASSLSFFSHRWFFPIIGHMGICTSTGVILDFAGPYFVSVSPHPSPLGRVRRLRWKVGLSCLQAASCLSKTQKNADSTQPWPLLLTSV